MNKIKKLVKEKLCKKGEAYRKRRMAAGEKSSAYLSGRAVKVCKGQMSGKKKKTNENESPSLKAKIAADDFMYQYRKAFRIVDGNFGKEAAEEFKNIVKSKMAQLQEESIKEAYSGFIRNPDDPDFEPFNPTGAVAEFREEIRALFGKFKGDLKNPEFIKGVAQIMNNWKPLLRSQLEENVASNHNGKSAPYGSGYKELNVDKMAESLRDWFKKEDWVRINTSGNISGDCGTMKKGKATTRCLPKKKAQSLTKAERKATVAKKVRGSKKGKQFVSVNENFEMGDRVKLTPDYEETPGEVFTITQTSGNKYFIADEDGRGWYTYGDQLVMADDEYINEAKKKKKKEKKDPPIGKPKRGGSKAYYVYVRDPKTKKVKKVSFGSGGLRAKIRNPKARKAFAARHNCKNKKDRTKAGYWSCNLPRYAPQLGLGAKMNTFW